ncbi:MAG TPA: hypothetical protein VN682_20465 [Terriglobales bacterium]|nr:hypothetical protein [Terriglobales bacterium]
MMIGEKWLGRSQRRLRAAILLTMLGLASAASANPGPPSPAVAPTSTPKSIHIVSVSDGTAADVTAQAWLGSYLGVHTDAPMALDPSHYNLVLNGHVLKALHDTTYDPDGRQLIFHLQRNSDNAEIWNQLLGGPTSFTIPMSVALTEEGSTVTLVGQDGKPFKISFIVIPVARLLVSVLVIGLVFLMIWSGRRSILKDNLIPQIDPVRQTYSLARTQMAWWFCLVFASFIFLYIVLQDPNTLTDQALMLMGVSGATALASVVMDATKDSAAGDVNSGLRLIGIKSFADVIRLEREIADRTLALQNTTLSDQDRLKLSSGIIDRQLTLHTYEDQIAPFVSEGWWKDIVTDINGTALHRLQVVGWSLALGIIFVVDVWRTLAMPQLSPMLLAVLGLSGAGYIGFKYPEKQQ